MGTSSPLTGIEKQSTVIRILRRHSPASRIPITSWLLRMLCPPSMVRLRNFDAARRAVALDDGLAESHSALAHVLMGQRKWDEAENEFRRAIALNPSYSSAHRLYAALLGAEKRFSEAWEQINEAMRSDPLSLPNNAEVVRTLYYRGDYDGALQQAQKALQLNPDYYRTHFWMGRVYARKKMHHEAVEESRKVLRAMPDGTVGLTEMAYSLATAGRQPEARKILDHRTAKSRNEFVPFYNLAVIHTALGENQMALEYLQKAYDEQDWALAVIAAEPRLDPWVRPLSFGTCSQD